MRSSNQVSALDLVAVNAAVGQALHSQPDRGRRASPTADEAVTAETWRS
jgi:hypothetical protein